MIDPDRERLIATLGRHAALAIAVSGGVDSMTLAHVATRVPAVAVTIHHAVSPAVPASATARVRDHAARFGWTLRVLDAGEFADPSYVANPVNRCYFCKSNLYGRIAATTRATIASGTNLDDLGDFRPGLGAAAEHGVVHPFVEAGLDKAAVYTLAGAMGLTDLARLPAQPCLSSRVETGIVVTPAAVGFIETVESALAGVVGDQPVIRCRITAAGVVIEAAPTVLAMHGDAIEATTRALCGAFGRVFAGTRAYRRGAAFLQPNDAHGRS